MKSSDIVTLMNDRVIVKKYGGPKKVGSFFVPENVEEKRHRSKCLFGKIVKFGLDTNIDEAYNLKVGDIITMEPLAQDCDTKVLEDGEFVWVPQEWIQAKVTDQDLIAELEDGFGN